MKRILLLLSFTAVQYAASAQWLEQSSGFPVPGIGVIDLRAIDDQVAWAVGRDMSGPGAVSVQYFTRTTTGGTDWYYGTIDNAPGMDITSIAATDDQTAWVSLNSVDSLGNTTGKIFKTMDGGTVWTHQTTAAFASPRGFVNKVHFFDTNNGLAIGNVNGGYFEIYTTNDGGTNWTRVPQANIPAPLSNEFGYVNVISTVANKVWFGTTRARVFISNDRGMNWVAAQTGLTRNDPTLPVITNVDFRNENIGLVQNDSTMRRSNDGGLTWTDINYTGPVHHYDLRYVTGSQQTWISTGANYIANDVGSSISYNDGLDWVMIDDTVLHTVVDFVNPNVGWSGGLNTNITQGGMFKWSGTSAAPAVTNRASQFVFPNPATGEVTVSGLANNQRADILVVDVLGRTVHKETYHPQNEAARITLPSGTSGIHYLIVQQEGSSQRHKLVVK